MLAQKHRDQVSKATCPTCGLSPTSLAFNFDQQSLDAFHAINQALPHLSDPDWNEPFEFMCDASDDAVGAVLVQGKDKKPSATMRSYRPKSTMHAHWTDQVYMNGSSIRNDICGLKCKLGFNTCITESDRRVRLCDGRPLTSGFLVSFLMDFKLKCPSLLCQSQES